MGSPHRIYPYVQPLQDIPDGAPLVLQMFNSNWLHVTVAIGDTLGTGQF